MERLSSDNARTRIQIEYIETPNMRLTHAQLGRLCDLPQDVCADAIASLVANSFLMQGADGRLLRDGLGRKTDAILGPDSLAIAS